MDCRKKILVKKGQHPQFIFTFAVAKLLVAQLVEQLTLNQWVGGSNPPRETKATLFREWLFVFQIKRGSIKIALKLQPKLELATDLPEFEMK